MYPYIKIHNLYSLHLYDGLEIILDVNMLDYKALENKDCFPIHLIPDLLIIKEHISIIGYKLNESTYIVNSNGSLVNISYTCSNNDIVKGVGYLYDIYKNRWNPKPYRPED